MLQEPRLAIYFFTLRLFVNTASNAQILTRCQFSKHSGISLYIRKVSGRFFVGFVWKCYRGRFSEFTRKAKFIEVKVEESKFFNKINLRLYHENYGFGSSLHKQFNRFQPSLSKLRTKIKLKDWSCRFRSLDVSPTKQVLHRIWCYCLSSET
jgi:hypothetical protein